MPHPAQRIKKAPLGAPFIGASIAPRLNERLASCGQMLLPFIENIHDFIEIALKSVSGRQWILMLDLVEVVDL